MSELGAREGMSVQSAATQQATQANSQLKSTLDYQYKQNYANTPGLPSVKSPSELGAVSPTSTATRDTTTGITYYPSTSGQWVQKDDPSAASYQPADQIKTNLPAVSDTSVPFISPTGVKYYPLQSVNGGQAGWIQNSNPDKPGYIGQNTNPAGLYSSNQYQYTTQKGTYVDPSAYFKSPNVGTSGASGTTINGQDNMIQTVNPYAPGYVSANTLTSAQQSAQQNAEANRRSTEAGKTYGLGVLDDLLVGLDKMVGKAIPGGWGTIATIAGSVVGGPLGATIANATAGAVQGKSIEDIAKGAALTFALAYGTQALSEALTSTVNAGVEQGVIPPSSELSDTLTQFADSAASIDTATGLGNLPQSVIDAANATSDPIAALNAAQGFTNVDVGYLQSIGAGQDLINAAVSANEAAGFTSPTQPVAPTGEVPQGPVSPTEATTPVSEGPQVPGSQTQNPYNIQSNGISDMPEGTIVNNGQDVVMANGKTVPLEDYTNAINSNQPISVDGQITTTYEPQGTVTVGGAGTTPTESIAPTGPSAPNYDYSTLQVDNSGNVIDKLTGENLGTAAENGFTPTGSGTFTAPDGSILQPAGSGIPSSVIAGGAAAAALGVAVAAGGGGGAAASAATPSAVAPTVPSAVAPVAPSAPTTVTPMTPEPTPVQPTAPTGTTTPTTPTAPTGTTTTPGTGTTTPTGPTVPGTTTPSGTVTPGTGTPTPGNGTVNIPGTGGTSVGLNPALPNTPTVPGATPGTVPAGTTPTTPVSPTTPTTTTTPEGVNVHDYSQPYNGEYSNQSVLERYMSGTISYGDIAGLIAAGLVLPSVLGLIGPQQPGTGKKGYGPLAPIEWGKLSGGLTNPGLNPGYLTFGGAPPPMYQTTNDVQSQYYWGMHPYMHTKEDLANYNQVNAPAQPFGIQQAQGPWDYQKFIRETIGTPQYQAAAQGSGQTPGTFAPATSYAGGTPPVTQPQVPNPTAATFTPSAQPMAYNPQSAVVPETPVVPQVNMNFTPVTVPTNLPNWAPGQWDLTQPVTPYGTTPAPVKV